MEELKQAALRGDTELLLRLHKHDPLILDKITAGCAPIDTPLHVAALKGHTEFAKQLLSLCPGLAGAVDSRGSSPLHYAAAKGFVEIVREIMRVDPDTCAAVDRDGLNALHLAAANGKVDVVRVLVGTRPDTARAKTSCGETVLHLCAKYDQTECLNLLMASLGINDRDDFGYTTLHVPVAEKQTQAMLAKGPEPEEANDEEEKYGSEDETLCGACDETYTCDDFWICCDICDTWFHGKCVSITPAKAEHMAEYKCPSCNKVLDSMLGEQLDKAMLSKGPEPEANDEQEKDSSEEETLCGACSGRYTRDTFWIGCDFCEMWFHGRCVNITPAMADRMKEYKCSSCNNKGGRH